MTVQFERPLSFVCMKYGTRYGADYVNRLVRAVNANLSLPHRAVCFTDDPSGVMAGVETRPFPDFGLPREKWFGKGTWPKVSIFAPGMFADDEIVLYLDLDVMVLGPLDKFAERAARMGGMHMLREWNPPLYKLLPVSMRPDRGGQGSLLCFVAGEQRHVFDAFRADPEGIQARNIGDRDWWREVAREPHYVPHDWCASFKRHCVWYWPLNLILKPRKPDWPSLLIFHGKPRPRDLLTDDPKQRWGSRRKFGYGGVDWVKDYWRRYDG